MYIVYKTNLDYLIPDVRLHIGDLDNGKPRFSDSLIRTALTGGIKMLQRRWNSKYLVYVPELVVSELPSGYVYEADFYAAMQIDPSVENFITYVIPTGYVYASLLNGHGIIPSGLKENDVFRNPNAIFLGPDVSPISQEDEYPVVLAASLQMRRAQFSSSADVFQSWSDGEFTFSNLGSQRALSELLTSDQKALDDWFKKRLVAPLRSNFGRII